MLHVSFNGFMNVMPGMLARAARRSRRVLALGLGGVCLLLAACATPQGEYGGVYTEDGSRPYPHHGPVMTREVVGTGVGPWGDMYNFEEIDYAPAQ